MVNVVIDDIRMDNLNKLTDEYIKETGNKYTHNGSEWYKLDFVMWIIDKLMEERAI